MSAALTSLRESLPEEASGLLAGARLLAAYSGGLDSTVLVHLLKSIGLNPTAVHINHHLQAKAASWAQHCRESCLAWSVPIVVVDVAVPSGHPAGPEAAAREARYEALRGCMHTGDVLATAHHEEDQAETVLLRLFRGTGISGLAAMRRLSDFAPGRLWRPLLDVSREELKEYARVHGLRWIEDPHNDDPRYARSFLRHEIMGRLKQRWPQVSASLARAARLAAESDSLLAAAADADLAGLELPPHAPDCPLSVVALHKLPPARRRNALRFWLERQGLELPPEETLLRMDAEVLRAAEDATPLLAWGQTELRRFRGAIYAMRRLPEVPAGAEIAWTSGPLVRLPEGCGRIVCNRAPKIPLAIRFPAGGERIKPRGYTHTRTLKNLFQEAGVPAWVRARVPLVYEDGKLVAVADRWFTAEFRARCTKAGLKYSWEHSLPGDPGV